jgi:hypothetical protein
MASNEEATYERSLESHSKKNIVLEIKEVDGHDLMNRKYTSSYFTSDSWSPKITNDTHYRSIDGRSYLFKERKIQWHYDEPQIVRTEMNTQTHVEKFEEDWRNLWEANILERHSITTMVFESKRVNGSNGFSYDLESRKTKNLIDGTPKKTISLDYRSIDDRTYVVKETLTEGSDEPDQTIETQLTTITQEEVEKFEEDWSNLWNPQD